jgi:hypothetical protein
LGYRDKCTQFKVPIDSSKPREITGTAAWKEVVKYKLRASALCNPRAIKGYRIGSWLKYIARPGPAMVTYFCVWAIAWMAFGIMETGDGSILNQ